MPVDEPQRHLICYDVADPKRLNRVHRFVSKRAVALQYSVFVAECRASDLETLLQSVETLIKRTEDDVRVYPLPRRAAFATMGRAALPDDVMYVDATAWNTAMNGDLRTRNLSETGIPGNRARKPKNGGKMRR